MASVFDVAQYILEKRGPMSAMKLQKLVYYSQAWHTVWTDNRLFSSKIEAWKDGPVCPDLWKEHAGEFRVTKLRHGDPDKLSDREKKTVKQVLKFYGKHNAQWLSDLSHSEDPWLQARRGIRSGAASNNEITTASMHEYYHSL